MTEAEALVKARESGESVEIVGQRGESREVGTAAGLGDSGVYAARAAAGVMMVSYSTGVNRA
ncbi:hypothetical protein, partial [Streptomyces tendae]|uniref:hypothetical protein n=1 Tax=Streptomyces tendae TaxID=1932 RepID=UPI0037216420